CEGSGSFMFRTRLLSISLIALAFIFLLNNFLPLHASAHTNSYGYMDIHESPAEIQIDLTLDYDELAKVVDLPINIESTSVEGLEAELTTKKDEIKDYLSTGIRLYRDELICEPQFTSSKVSMMDNHPL